MILEPTFEETTKQEVALPPPVTMAPLDISELRIDPPEVRPGQTVTISFKATNINDVPSYYTVTLKVNGEVMTTQGVSLRRRGTLPMSFTVSRTLPGYYKVEVNDWVGGFTILR